MNRIKSITLGIAFAIAAVFGYVPMSSSAAGNASLTLTGAGAHQIDTNFSVSIYENSGTETVNVVESDITYDASKLQFVSIDASGSAFGIDAYSANTGSGVTITRGVSGGATVTGSKLVATVVFKAIVGSGSTNISFANSSKIYRSPDSANIWNGVTSGATYSFSTPAPTPTPTPTPTPQPVTTTPKPTTTTVVPTQTTTPTTTPSTTLGATEQPQTTTQTPTTTNTQVTPTKKKSGNVWGIVAILAAVAAIAVAWRNKFMPAKSAAVIYTAPEATTKSKSSAAKKKTTASKSTKAKKPAAKKTAAKTKK